MKLTRLQQRVFDSVVFLISQRHQVTAVKVGAAIGMAHRTVSMHLTNLKKKGLIVYYSNPPRWELPPPEEPELPDTWNMARAEAFGVSVRIVDDAPLEGELLQVGFNYEFLWPRSRTHRINWKTDLNAAVRTATREVIKRTAKGLQVPEAEAELYLVRHATVRKEAQQRRESEVISC